MKENEGGSIEAILNLESFLIKKILLEDRIAEVDRDQIIKDIS